MIENRNYQNLKQRLSHARSWAGDITKGNRCALVVGAALRVKPGSTDLNFRQLSAVEESVRNQPFLEKFFVKAQQLAGAIEREWPTKSVKHKGRDLVPRNRCVATIGQLDGKQGVIFLQDCWKTPREKVADMLYLDDKQTGDHIDLWNGWTTEIYNNRKSSLQLIGQSALVWFWETSG